MIEDLADLLAELLSSIIEEHVLTNKISLQNTYLIYKKERQQRSLIVLQHWTKQMLFWQNASFQAENEECVTLKYQAHQQ